MEHVEVLERLRGVLEHGKMGDKCLIAPDLVTAAIAALSAPQPPAEAQPVAWLGANPRTGAPELTVRTPAPTVMRDFAMRPLYAHPPPSAPVGVEAVVADMRRWVRLVEASGPYAAGRTAVLQEWANQLEALAQQPAAVDEDDFDCPHSAFDNCDCYADQQGGES